MKTQLARELMPVLQQLQNEGYKVYSYTPSYGEIASLFWYENGRVLNIQANSWRHSEYARDRWDIGVSYIPGYKHGSGCGLSQGEHDTGVSASEILRYRKYPTWVHGIENYKNIEGYIKNHTPLKYHELDSDGTFKGA